MSEPKFLQTFNEKIQRHSDLILAIGVVVIIGLLIVRIPPQAMDYFLAINISLGFVVLMVSLYVKDALKVPSFPTILLLTTLFRLALNVSTTRLILLEADAGAVIQTFGQFVVGGNFVVGAVVFLVLVIVQFVVIAKGSERVAEVAARFTLDAMPGKQMSIDADLRNGLVDAAGARLKRQELERESKLYGAMDGAMKFVKGDAIAGIIISIVNILGGLVIGVMQQGMALGEAAEVYSLLTIGDGLVSQIPALLISISAGLIVTRVASSDEDDASGDAAGGSLARDLLDQVTANPKGLAIAASIMLLIGITGPTTGFPMPPFLGMGALMGVMAWSQIRVQAAAIGATAAAAAAGRAGEDMAGAAGESEADEPQSFAPPELVLQFDAGLKDTFLPSDPGTNARIRSALTKQRVARSRDLGLHFPSLSFQLRHNSQDDFSYSVLAHDGVIARGTMSPYNVYAIAEASVLQERGYQAVPATPPGWMLEVSLLTDLAEVPRAQEEKLPLMLPDEAVLDHVDRVCRQRADVFLGLQESAKLIEALRDKSPDLVKAVLPTLLNLQQISEVLKGLLREQVSIRDLRQVFETLARWGGLQKDPAVLVELVRREMRLALCGRYSEDGSSLRFYSLDQEMEGLLSENAAGQPLSTEERMQIVNSIQRIIDPRRHLVISPVILVRNPLIRAPLRRLIEDRLPEVSVLSQEVTSGFILQEMERATLNEVGA
ncbi:MAG: type III secretion protein V [Planctomycetota bacterium]|jgi:type III secretion protein V